MSDSDSDEDNIIRYGTPLEPYEEDELPTKRKYQQAPDQYAVDAHGRRRFHGAFTGGFSAGFGNTVGSIEGWTPSTFKSSRSEKASFSNQRPEDFMDEEDRGEFGIAPRQLQTHNEFSGQKRQRQWAYHDGPIPGEPVLQQLVKAVHETAAVKMLRAMGWREGQGTGERVTRQQKRAAKQQHKVYGCYLPEEMRGQRQEQQDSDSDASSSEYDISTLFAPDDYEPYVLSRKSDRFGLGYTPLSRHAVLGTLTGEYGSDAGTSRSHLVMKDKGKKVSIRGQAFGVGAFEADDDDIYAREDMSHYDFAIGGPEPVQQKKIKKDQSKHILSGFVKAVKPLPSVPSYPAPALPRDYVPLPAGTRRTRFEPTTHKERDQGLGRHELTAEARGALLGETPIVRTEDSPNTPEVPPETAEQAKTTDLTKILGRNINFTNEQKELDFIPIKDTGKDIQKVFKPFASNKEKQSRYEMYLENKGSVSETGNDRLSAWERERELVEFEQAAKLYRPLSGIMGDRFTHASEPDDGALNPLCAVAKSSANHGQATKEQMEAAQKGVYGVMTRVQSTWRPEALVSKRFNVPEVGGARIEPKKDDKPKVSYSIFSYLESSVHDKDSFAKEQSKFSGSKSLPTNIPKNNTNNQAQNISTDESSKITSQKTNQVTGKVDQVPGKVDQVTGNTEQGFSKRMTVAEMFLKESEQNKSTEISETLNKFDKMDLYKSIFLSDSEEEIVEEKKSNEISDFIDVPKNTERNPSPPRGIFANIDFDEINSWKRREKSKTPEKETKIQEEEVYGPKIPDNIIQKKIPFEEKDQITISSSEDSWVDANELKNKSHKKSKKKKDKKHKSKKKKSKSKKKDK
ncbi:G patch domain-containing protein 1 homolog [Anticarsia gemmatalis]|uniref:G patch domain-containing protein 1 homolog n=1 Tax=Anticarsia gemmatalis TaxID=129554 RepID=UPI003F76BAC5